MIGGVLGFIGRHWRGILLWVLVAIGFWWSVATFGAGNVLQILFLIFATLFQLAFAILFVLIQFVALFWFLGRGRVYWIMPGGETGISFKDYRGNEQVLEVSARIVTLLRGVRDFKRMGGEVSRGLLLIGPPGTGKTYLAQAIATEAGVPFAYASAPGFQNMFMGVGNLRITMLYAKARRLARRYGSAIIFIDEIDAVGTARTSQMGGGAGMMGGMFGGGGMGMLNTLLLEMDPPNVDTSWKARILRRLGLRRGRMVQPVVLTIGATNISEVLDQALLRPGRFDRKITIDPPDFDGRKDVIQYYVDKVRHDPNIDLDKIAADTVGYTPVSIKYLINEAAVVAHFEGRDYISYQDFSQARETNEWGLRQPIRSMSDKERRRLAYHETGHAISMALLQPENKLYKVTIIRYGRALGLAASTPLEERYTQTREEILSEIKVALASRAAEELFLGTGLTGVTSDLQQATRLAMGYFGFYGMGNSFYSYLAMPSGLGGIDPDTKRRIEALLDEQYREVKQLLAEHADEVHIIAERLLEELELHGEDVKDILEAQRSQREPVGAGVAALTGYAGGLALGQESNGPSDSPGPNGNPVVSNDSQAESSEETDKEPDSQ
ncbi:MAG: AAA family ATPase [Chloroflexi bacterium]|nr:AAA family ATPase [Chloroflexota bacterium]